VEERGLQTPVRRRVEADAAGADDADWRADLLADLDLRAPTGTRRNRLRWPGYDGAAAVRVGSGTVAGTPVVAVVWDGSVHGGSIGERDAAAFAAAADEAVRTRRPLVSFLRSGGTRLQEGVAGLIGLPRVALATASLAGAGVGHVAVVDHPTTGGVWVTVASQADVRVAVAGATVGFVGPRVLAAVTGSPPPPDSHTAAAAHAAGLVDAVLEPEAIPGWLGTALSTLAAAARRPGPDPGLNHETGSGRPEDAVAVAVAVGAEAGAGEIGHTGVFGVDGETGAGVGACLGADDGWAPERSGWEQVGVARAGPRPDAGEVLAALLPAGVDLAGRDRTVGARLGRLPDGAPAVGVALAARRRCSPGADGYRMLTRAARLAGRLRLPLVTLVDTPGADPSPASEADGVAGAIGEAMTAVLDCPSPTVSLIVGEGGSGGALAAACTDVLLIHEDGYLTALSPEGVAATVHTRPENAADAAGLRPTDLIRLGIVDDVVRSGGTGINGTASVVAALTASVRAVAAREPTNRMGHRYRKWSTEAGGHL
jgi:acetyl-CoA carboxylase carboxyl transferase subunit beta